MQYPQSRSVPGLLLAAVLLAAPWGCEAKVIPYAKGSTVMVEQDAGMREVQFFHAPTARYSIGVGHLDMDAGASVSYARVNVLAKRWNRPSSQANLVFWGSMGVAHDPNQEGGASSHGGGAQIDYETRQVYLMAKTDLLRSRLFSQRTDTIQLGYSPTPHDFDTWAKWIVLQNKRTVGDFNPGSEMALLLRAFKHRTWIEAGLTTKGEPVGMVMFTF